MLALRQLGEIGGGLQGLEGALRPAYWSSAGVEWSVGSCIFSRASSMCDGRPIAVADRRPITSARF